MSRRPTPKNNSIMMERVPPSLARRRAARHGSSLLAPRTAVMLLLVSSGSLIDRLVPQRTSSMPCAASALVLNNNIPFTQRRSRLFQTNGEGKDTARERQREEPDLFEYFDPLLSPHAYPNGISPDVKPETPPPPPKKASFANPFGIDYMSRKERKEDEEESASSKDPMPAPAAAAGANDDEDNTSPDLLDYFDPLLSPHAYPNGISPTKKPQPLEEDERYNPLKMNSDVMSGAVSIRASSSRKKIGILLMDHGSRNPASNARLHRLAELYQLSLGENDVDGGAAATESEIFVTGAHMEIATPSIPDGLQKLLAQGVDEIVCHPYFLSPGRHVTEDIPEIVNQAIADLAIKIPVITTDPVGSNTQLMIGAIHSLVRENSQVLRQQKKNN